MEEPTITVVVRAFNEEEHIGRLLFGITRQTVGMDEVQIVVVDSGSTDDTVAVARQYPVELVHITPEEFTFGRALNRGCAKADGEYLVFASAHVYPVYDDWLETLLTPFEDKRIGAVYGRQRGGEETKYSERQVFARLYPEESVPLQDSPFCNNANCAIRRSLWEEVPYNEHLTGLEDLEWARRIMERGYQVSYAADAVVVHVHDETEAEVRRRHMREAIAMKEIYPDQSMSLLDFVRLFVTNAASDFAHAIRDGQLLANLLAIPRFRFMQFWGAYKGFQQSGPLPARVRRRFYYPRGFRAAETPDSEEEGRRRIDYPAAGEEVQ